MTKKCLCLLLGALLLVGPDFARPAAKSDALETGSAPKTQSDVIDALRTDIRARMDSSLIPGVAIAIVDGDKTVWAEGFGLTERNGTQRVTPDTLFSMQSITKHFLVLGFLKAIDAGILSLDEHVTDVLPTFKVHSRWGEDETKKMTFRQLLGHWAGLTHEAPVGNNYDFRNTSLTDHLASISDTWLRFPVGARYSYSNLGIDMTGYALEKRSGKPLAAYLRDEVLNPLGMTMSTVDEVEAWHGKSVAKGHPTLGVGVFPYNPMVPSGGMYSSVNDISRYLIARLNGGPKIVSQKSLDEMCTVQFPLPGQRSGYGLGTYIDVWHGTMAYGHMGEGFGYRTYMKWVPQYKVGVVVLANSNVNVYDVPAIANHALELQTALKTGSSPAQISRTPNSKTIIALPLSSLKNLEGTYALGTTALVRFEVKDGGLYVGDHSNGEFFRLSAHSPTEFSSDLQRNQNTFLFELDATGKATSVVVLSDGFVQRFSLNDRPDDKQGPNREGWAAWTGTYTATPMGSVGSGKADSFEIQTVGPQEDVNLSVRNGFLYLKFPANSPETSDNQIKLSEWKDSLFFTSDGETVEFLPGKVVIGNIVYTKK
jgi:CubicO group peptidase (beta-lactamase class C family)